MVRRGPYLEPAIDRLPEPLVTGCRSMGGDGDDGAVTGHPLDNAVWQALSTHHGALAEVKGRSRRYRINASFFGGVDSFDEESWEDLAALVGPSSEIALFCSDVPPVPDAWSEVARGIGEQMVVSGDDIAAAEPVEARPLGDEHVAQMLDLVAVAQPGPFRPRTIELGRYYGYFEGERLLAMAGERLHLEGYTEISAVCTHADVRGRGLASSLTLHVAMGIIERGEQPFLHVADDNHNARRIYERLGFAVRRPIEFALVESPA